MATTADAQLNGYLSTIAAAKYGKDARAAMANAIQRCYVVAKIRSGSAIVSQSAITEHTDRIRNAVFGEEVRDAFQSGILLCYTERGKPVSSPQNLFLSSFMMAKKGVDLKTYINSVLVRCYNDVSS